jgi:F-type H+-transporting ATPase subunit delta
MAAMGGSVARRYARALFGIGIDAGNFEALGREIDDLSTLLVSSPELRNALENPVFRPEEKRAVLEQILPRVTPTAEVRRFVLLLLERRRLVILPAIARAYRDLADAHAGRVRAKVTSAEPLSPAALEGIRRALGQRTGKQVLVEVEVDPGLIGGVIARVGDLVLDGSVRTQLDELRTKLVN